MTNPPNPTNEVYAIFAGTIDQAAVQRIFQSLAIGMTNSVTGVHLLFQSTGGFVAEGVCLYNFFRTLPIELTLYNVGGVYSIATLAYLGAQNRKASAHAMFMVHRSHVSPLAANADRLKSITDSLALDDQRTETILRQHLTMPEEMWASHRFGDLYITADQAVSFGLATSIGEFSPPTGTRLFQI